MRLTPTRSPVTIRSPGIAGQAPGVDGARGGARPARDLPPCGNAPVERVIEGELLEKSSACFAQGKIPHAVASATLHGHAPAGDGMLYALRADAAIGAYLETALAAGPHGCAHGRLDLYA